MQFDFLTETSPDRNAVEAHIREVYRNTYGADVTGFAPLLASARDAQGRILCAAGLRLDRDGFFSDCYLDGDFPSALRDRAGLEIGSGQIMEVTSLASTSPFPVLPMLDRMIEWGRAQGIVCGVFTATLPLRKLLRRTGLGYVPLCAAHADHVADPERWGSYYATDPWVCAFVENDCRKACLTPVGARPRLQGGAA